MWTATITSQTKEATGDGGAVVVVAFEITNGTVTLKKQERISDPASIKKIIQDAINAAYDIYDKTKDQGKRIDDYLLDPIPNGAVDLNPPPTQAELDRKAYDAALDKVQEYNQLISDGVITDQDAGYQAALADVKAKFKPEYV